MVRKLLSLAALSRGFPRRATRPSWNRTLEHLASAPVTLPPPSTTAAPPLSSPPAPAVLAPVRFPLSWLLEHASAPLRYRAMTEVARLPSQSADRISFLPFTHRPALM